MRKLKNSPGMKGFLASDLFARGLFPFPLRGHDPGDLEAFKRLLNSGWQGQAKRATTRDLDNWDHRRSNLGLHLGPSNLVVIDTDTPEAEAWVSVHLPRTPWTTRTAKGRHRYYRLPDGMAPPPNNKPLPGMDRKAAGGYVLSPGCWHFAKGVRYKPEGDWTASIDTLPVYDPAWFPAKGPKPVTKPARRRSVQTVEATRLSEAIAYIEKCEPAVQGENGQTTLFNAAMKCRSILGLGLEDTLSLLWDHFNPNCVPPWEEDEWKDFEHHVRDAWERAKVSIDCDTRKELTATADMSRESWVAILEHLETLFPSQKGFLASDVLTAYEARRGVEWQHPHLRDALDAITTNPRGLNVRGVGNLLKARRNRNYGGRKLEGVTGGKQGMVYRIVQVGGKAAGGTGESGDSASPRPGGKRAKKKWKR